MGVTEGAGLDFNPSLFHVQTGAKHSSTGSLAHSQIKKNIQIKKMRLGAWMKELSLPQHWVDSRHFRPYAYASRLCTLRGLKEMSPPAPAPSAFRGVV